jgi:hypothetical protein
LLTHFPAFVEQLIKPRCLFLRTFIAVQRHNPHTLIDKRVTGFLETGRAVLGKRELGTPVSREAAGSIGLLRLFMIACNRNARNHPVQPAAGPKPFTRLGIRFRCIDEVRRRAA